MICKPWIAGNKMLRQIIEKFDFEYIEVDSEDKFLQLFRKSLLYKPTSPVEYYYMGVYYLTVLGHEGTAKKYFKYGTYLGDINCTLLLGDIYSENNKKKAKLFYKMVMHRDVRGFYKLGLYYENLKNYERAMQYYEKASDKGHSESMNCLAFLYADRKDYENAKIWYQQAIALGNSSALYNLALLYQNLGDPIWAEKYYRQVLALGPIASNQKFDDSLDNLARILMSQNKNEEAFLLFSEYPQHQSKVIVCTINSLKYPISSTNKDKIYSILETIELPDAMYEKNLFKIMQDVVAHRQKALCQIAYYYKNLNL